MYTQIKNIYKKRELLIGTIFWLIFLLIAFVGSKYNKILDDLTLIISALFFSIPFVLSFIFANSDNEILSNTIFIIAVFINSYLIAITYNKLLTEKPHYSKWIKYGLGYIGVNIIIFAYFWYFHVLPALENFLKVFLRIIGSG